MSVSRLPQRADFLLSAYPARSQVASREGLAWTTCGRQLARDEHGEEINAQPSTLSSPATDVLGATSHSDQPASVRGSYPVGGELHAGGLASNGIGADEEAAKRFWVLVVFIAVATLHSLLVFAWWGGLVKKQRSSRDSLSPMLASFMWAVLSYRQDVQHTQLARFWPRIEVYAVKSFFPLCLVAQAWGQGCRCTHVSSQELATGDISCAATMAVLVGYIMFLINCGHKTFEDWRSRVSCQTSRRACNTWQGMFFLTRGLRLYAWQAEPSMAAQRGETMHHCFLVTFVLALVFTFVLDCDHTLVSGGRALPVVVLSLAFFVMAGLASCCSAFKDGKDGSWEMSSARGIMFFLVYISIFHTFNIVN